MTSVDAAVICAYLVCLPIIAICLSGRQRTASNYLGATHELPWWALCLSLVATETSTLTVISVPGVAFGSGLVFVGLAIGYLVGRSIVAWAFLPLYMNGGMTSAYQYLGLRFGASVQRLVSASFLMTRLLAEGVRLFAGMLPIAALLSAMHTPLPNSVILGIIVVCTLAYTVFGGLSAVVWSDTIQFCTYLLGAIICIFLLGSGIDRDALHIMAQAGKFDLFKTGGAIFTNPFTPLAAVAGGAVLSMASHGTDQLMVQRVLAARSLGDARKALIGSAFLVGFLFLTLSLVGVLLWHRASGATLHDLGLKSPDALFPDYIVHNLPPGLAGLLIAGIFSATMGSLSSSLNAMASATVSDFSGFCNHIAGRLKLSPLGLARLVTLVWGAALVATASSFSAGSGSVVLFGLSVAAYSYGAMLGVFLFGMLSRRATSKHAATAFIATLVTMACVMTFVHPGGKSIAFSWMVPFGVISCGLFGYAFAALDKRQSTA